MLHPFRCGVAAALVLCSLAADAASLKVSCSGLGQELGGYAATIRYGVERLDAVLPRVRELARELVREVRSYQMSDAALGPHLADQWALPLALMPQMQPINVLLLAVKVN